MMSDTLDQLQFIFILLYLPVEKKIHALPCLIVGGGKGRGRGVGRWGWERGRGSLRDPIMIV